MTDADVIEKFGGPSAVARRFDCGQSTVSEMKRRGRIPLEYWPRLIHARQGKELGLSYDLLARLHIKSMGLRA